MKNERKLRTNRKRNKEEEKVKERN